MVLFPLFINGIIFIVYKVMSYELFLSAIDLSFMYTVS